MVHLRARNLPSKGVLKEWLFSENKIKIGQDFALVETSKGEFTIKSNYSGVIVKTIKLGSTVKNGSIIANITVDEDQEIIEQPSKNNFKNSSTKESIEEPEIEEKFDIEIPMNIPISETSKFQDAEDYRDDFSGAVLYDKNYMAVTPFSSTRDDIVDSEEKLNKLEDAKGLDKFAQMRKNIADSIKNSPAAANNKTQNDDPNLVKLKNEEVFNDSKMFQIDNSTGSSKFRKIIEARKAKLLKENDFKEIPEEEKIKSAMDRLDSNGRPMIMRNIINDRMKRLNESGGDPHALEEPNFVAPKVIRNNPEPKAKVVEDLEGESMWTSKKPQSHNDLEDEDFLIDSHDLDTHGQVQLPKKSPSQLLEEKKKSGDDGSYNYKKMASLYDDQRRESIISSRTQKDDIKNRMKAIMDDKNPVFNNNHDEFDADNLELINSLPILIDDVPERFLKKVESFDSKTGKKILRNYTDTKEGQHDFEQWMENENLSKHVDKDLEDIEKLLETDPEVFRKEKENKIALDKENQEKETQRVIDEAIAKAQKSLLKAEELKRQEEKIQQEKANFELSQLKNENAKLEEQLNLNKKTSKYLEGEIDNLKNQLKSVDKLENVVESMRQNNTKIPEKNNDEFFNKMMQYIMMQNMMQSIGGAKKNQDFDMDAQIRDAIQKNMKEFYNTFDSVKSSNTNGHNSDFNLKPEPEFKEFINPLTNQKMYQNQSLQDVQMEQEMFKNQQANFINLNPKQNLDYLNQDYTKNLSENREDISLTRYPAVKSMLLSQNYIPPLSISTEIDMTAILKLKHVLKKTDPTGLAFSTIAFIAKAVSLALEQYPKINSTYDPTTNQQIVKNYHNIGLATETSEGIVVPVLKFVEKLTVKQVAIDIREMTNRLRRGELFNYETTGSTITLANYGNVGAIHATPTIFYPNAAVIGIGKVIKKPIVVEKEKLAIKAIMSISLTVDQRIIDASESGRFLSSLKEILEKPELLMMN
ncbi:pyruvate dehydrogenase E2 component (dihydrolipoamide acetyltransferase) [Spiroplasma alleghenense]|uniref:Pyruvate dehydrogenase E2 component (Dihydrolipoamide acetyltransferase) n=2 Tax=Spiroplasma alleghenense TaxID=216931 RepID=A0A345Z470_9MOLU|nr:pyruvate dehydrogenase E2 component (dihydrolipoamide acetyltransferase) [Spiroplasma alleghenense]